MSDQAIHISQFYIKVNGTNLREDLMDALMTAEVDDSLYLPDMFTLIFSDKGLKILSENFFKLGAIVELSAKAPRGQKTKLMEGEITSIEPDLNSVDRGTLVIRGYDRSHRLTRGRKTKTFLNVTDSDLASQLAQGAGLSAQTDATSVVHKFVMQTNQTDFEFLLERARRIGYQLSVEDKKLLFKKPPAAPPAGPTLDWGISMDQFRARMSTMQQVNEVIVRGWDPQAKREIVGRATSPTSATQHRKDQGKTGGDAARSAHSVSSTQIIVDRPITNQSEADNIAKAELDAMASNFIQAEGNAGGDPTLIAGSKVTIQGVGSRFGGEYLVTRALHHYSVKGYSTRFWCNGGTGNTGIVDILKSHNGGGGGQNKIGAQEHVTTRGLMVGVVTNNNDPENLGRVRVKFPALGDNIESWWCRLSTIMAGPGQGVAYFPESGDEVIVAFEHGEPSRGIVLGAVWNGSDNLPKPIGQLVTGAQTIRRIHRTRKGHEFVLVDEPGKEGIELIDRTTKNFIKIITDTNKIHIECTGDIEVKSTSPGANINVTADTGNITVKASAGKMTLESLQDMEIKANAGKVKITGTAGVEINSPAQTKVMGTAMLDLSSAGVTSVKGSLLKLN
jgi:phage protein D